LVATTLAATSTTAISELRPDTIDRIAVVERREIEVSIELNFTAEKVLGIEGES
jgi:hypothetical protein